jgi:hypothetical protein
MKLDFPRFGEKQPENEASASLDRLSPHKTERIRRIFLFSDIFIKIYVRIPR